MKACTACGLEHADVPGACRQDDGPDVGAKTEPDNVVRARRAEPIPPARFGEIRVEVPPRRSGPLPAPTVVMPHRGEEERSLWPAIAVIALLAVGGLCGFLYYLITERNDLATEVTAQIAEARVAVAEARARVESLRPEHPLRGKILQLDKWDKELQEDLVSADRTRETAMRARDIASNARQIGEEARAAGSQSPAVITVPAPAVAPVSTVTPGTDPVAPAPAGGAAESTSGAVPPADADKNPTPAPATGTQEPPTPPAPEKKAEPPAPPPAEKKPN